MKAFLLNLETYKKQPVIVIDGEVSHAIEFIRKTGKGSKASLEIVKHYEDHKEDYPDDFMKGSTHSGRLYTDLPVTYVMLLKMQDSYIDTTDTIVHEALHLVHYIARDVGITLSKESEEAYTYLLGHITRELVKMMWPPDKKDKKKKGKSKK